MKTLVVFLLVSVFSEAFLTTFRKGVVISTTSTASEPKAVLNKVLPKAFIPELNTPASASTASYSAKEEVKVKAAPAITPVEVKVISRPRVVSSVITVSKHAPAAGPKLVAEAPVSHSEEAEKTDATDELPVADILEEEAGTNASIVRSVSSPATTEVEVKAPSIYSHAIMTDNNAKSSAFSNASEAVEHMVNTAEMKKKAAYTLSYAATRNAEAGAESYSYMTLYEKAEQLKAYAKAHHYSTKYGFIVNMGMKSGKKRFFIVDLTTMTIVKNGVVAHGRGSSRFTLDKKYSNEQGSNCTSLGIYKVGRSYEGIFGKSFRLYGLQHSNSNAYKRSIVLHSMHNIPNDEIDFPIFQSEGCPSVSPEFLDCLQSIISHSSKPVLMWLFDPSTESTPLYSMN